MINAKRILLVEDNIRLQRSAAFLLTIFGFEVQTAEDGQTALRLFSQSPPDLILSDIDLPNLNGYDLLRAVRQGCPSVPFVFMSDRYSLDDLLFALDLGASDYLPKPFDVYDLVEAVERTLGLSLPRQRRLAS